MMQTIRDGVDALAFHYKEGNLNYPMATYISLVHIVAFVGLMKLPNCSYETLIWAFTLWPIRYVAAESSCFLSRSNHSLF